VDKAVDNSAFINTEKRRGGDGRRAVKTCSVIPRWRNLLSGNAGWQGSQADSYGVFTARMPSPPHFFTLVIKE